MMVPLSVMSVKRSAVPGPTGEEAKPLQEQLPSHIVSKVYCSNNEKKEGISN